MHSFKLEDYKINLYLRIAFFLLILVNYVVICVDFIYPFIIDLYYLYLISIISGIFLSIIAGLLSKDRFFSPYFSIGVINSIFIPFLVFIYGIMYLTDVRAFFLLTFGLGFIFAIIMLIIIIIVIMFGFVIIYSITRSVVRWVEKKKKK